MFYDTNRGVTFGLRTEATALPSLAQWQATFEGGIEAVAFRPASTTRWAPRRPAHPRIYGALDALAPQEMAQEPHTGYAIPVTGRTPAEDQMAREWQAWKRATLKVARAELIRLLAAVLDEDIASSQVTFSDKAGCACSCSPGFIIKGVEGLKGLDNVSFRRVPEAE